jgi:hypothetical protein
MMLLSALGCWGPTTPSDPETRYASALRSGGPGAFERARIQAGDGGLLVVVSAELCGPCKRLGPLLFDDDDPLGVERIPWVLLDQSAEGVEPLMLRLGVWGPPTFIVLDGERPIAHSSGFTSAAESEAWIGEAISRLRQPPR